MTTPLPPAVAATPKGHDVSEPCICDTGLACYADEHDDWEATVDGWKAEIESMTEDELLASFAARPAPAATDQEG